MGRIMAKRLLVEAGVPEEVIVESITQAGGAIIRLEDIDDLRHTPCDYAVTELVIGGDLEVQNIEGGALFTRPRVFDA